MIRIGGASGKDSLEHFFRDIGIPTIVVGRNVDGSPNTIAHTSLDIFVYRDESSNGVALWKLGDDGRAELIVFDTVEGRFVVKSVFWRAALGDYAFILDHDGNETNRSVKELRTLLAIPWHRGVVPTVESRRDLLSRLLPRRT